MGSLDHPEVNYHLAILFDNAKFYTCNLDGRKEILLDFCFHNRCNMYSGHSDCISMFNWHLHFVASKSAQFTPEHQGDVPQAVDHFDC
jgi:hypothetical protein